MKKVFRDYDQVALDAQYEQRAWVPHADDIIRRFGVASDEVRARLGEPGTYAYGPSAAEALDVYGFSTRKALVFVHGGAWKRQSKRENAFAAETFLHAGAAYVALDFALLPAVTLPEMAAQVCRAIEWVASNLSENVFLCGHSSGAHLAACALTRIPSVKAALLVSGMYDLLPVTTCGWTSASSMNTARSGTPSAYAVRSPWPGQKRKARSSGASPENLPKSCERRRTSATA